MGNVAPIDLFGATSTAAGSRMRPTVTPNRIPGPATMTPHSPRSRSRSPNAGGMVTTAGKMDPQAEKKGRRERRELYAMAASPAATRMFTADLAGRDPFDLHDRPEGSCDRAKRDLFQPCFRPRYRIVPNAGGTLFIRPNGNGLDLRHSWRGCPDHVIRAKHVQHEPRPPDGYQPQMLIKFRPRPRLPYGGLKPLFAQLALPNWQLTGLWHCYKFPSEIE